MPLSLPESIAFEYEPLRKIGEGANGETWLLLHRAKKSQAVLKFLKFLRAEDFKAVELFQREAESLKSVNVEGVPKFYSYCTDEQGNGFLLQEYIPYPSLQSILDSGRVFSEQDAMMVALRIAFILMKLQGDYSPPIIHRDIKPSNVLYKRQDQSVWLIDFGSVANPQKRTGGSTIAGTFGYMSPEQMLGDVTLQSDYYALGATILHLITGVFPGDMPSHGFQIDLDDILREKAPRTTPELRELLASLLSPDIDKRPKNAQELCDAVQHAIIKPRLGLWDSIRRLFASSFDKDNWQITASEGENNGEILLEQGKWPFGWNFAVGMVRKIQIEDRGVSYIRFWYTFEHGDNTWLGTAEGRLDESMSALRRWAEKYDEHGASLGNDGQAKCKVVYNRHCPSENKAYSVLVPNK